MKRWLALLLLTVRYTAMSADDVYCNSQSCHAGCWHVGAAALYWKQSVLPFTFAATQAFLAGNNINPVLFSYKATPPYAWGFRVEAGWQRCDGCVDVTLDWAHVQSKGTFKVIKAGQGIVFNIFKEFEVVLNM